MGKFESVYFVTGGCGFIGSAFLNLFVPRRPETLFVNLDKLTYAGTELNVAELQSMPNFQNERIDIVDRDAVRACFDRHRPSRIFHFAAESHVDRSISGPGAFVQTNIVGTFNLLEAAREFWADREDKVFHHVSTDEVYGSLGDTGFFTEETRYDPSSPYSASKASSDHLVRAYYRTFGIPVKITNCSNNYGPRQFPEKLIPLMILNATEGKPLPVYGQGLNIRDWLYVDDHCRAIWTVADGGAPGETYNIGGNSERRNIDIVQTICDIVAERIGKPAQEVRDLISYVTDRPGHDYRYAIDASKIRTHLGWEPTETFESGIRKTVDWYLDHREWIDSVRAQMLSGANS